MLWPVAAVFAQTQTIPLDEHCTVSVLNRTAYVKPDGTFILPNTPANMGQVRVRATCTRDGKTISGQSDFFAIPSNGVVHVSAITPGMADPIPASLTIQSSTTTLTAIGQSVPLMVTALFPDGSTQEVSSAASGTNYTSSNPAIIAINADGVVTAGQGGTALISAIREGALGLIRINVTLSGDSDGDGIPDDVERANGLNPNDPVDALEDPDGDGLTNREELGLGTGIRTADSDGDGLADGREAVLGTNPLLFDTDRDGVGDGLEVLTGSDPLDPANVNLAQALQSLEARPSQFTLIVNTVNPVTSRQIQVIGHLIDGQTIDLTSTGRGTNYTASDLTICNFGDRDGEIFAGNNGVCTITVTNSGHSAQADGVVRSFAPVALSSIAIPGYANNVDVSGNFAYVAAGAAGLQVVDVSNPLSPKIVGSMDTPGNANDVRVVGSFAYIADGTTGLQIVDVRTPTQPVLIGAVDTTGEAQDIVLSGTRAYLADGVAGLVIIDVVNPVLPVILGSIDTPGVARGVDISGALAIVADGEPSRAVRIIDVANPAAPQILGSVTIPWALQDVVVRGSIAYFVAYTGGLQIVDFSTPTLPTIVAAIPSSLIPVDVELSDSFALFAEVLFPNAVPIVDVSDPANPASRTVIDFIALGNASGTGIAVNTQFVYMTADTGLFIGQWRMIEDTSGISPTVRITVPTPKTAPMEGTVLPIRVEASDDMKVAAVRFLVDGMVVGTDFAPPYEFDYVIPVGVNRLILGATATDFGGNVGVSQDMELTVLPDLPPVVTITSPAVGAEVIEGSQMTIAVTAVDDIRVTQVVFRVDGEIIRQYNSPPYELIYGVPMGRLGPITIAVQAMDTIGHVRTTEVVITVIPDPPPVVTITSPAAGAEVIEGDQIKIAATVVDNTSVTRVKFLVNGEVIGQKYNTPYETTYRIPVGRLGPMTISVQATDTSGHIGTASVEIHLIPDPGTTVVGRIVMGDGAPVEGVAVKTIGGLSSTSGADGRFTLQNVPTIQGNIWVTAMARINNQTFNGVSPASPPIPSGTRDFGDIVIRVASVIAAGNSHTCILRSGEVWCWGDNYHGQLGDGTNSTNFQPVQVVGITTAVAISAATDHSCAILSDGTVWCWGHNDFYVIGSETIRYNEISPVPLQVVGITTAIAITTSETHTCVILMDQTVECWGYHYSRHNGADYRSYAFNTPVRVDGITTATAIAAVRHNTCVILSDQTVWCWGSQLVQMDGITTAIAISGIGDTPGLGQYYALLTNGTIKRWWGGYRDTSPYHVDRITTATAIAVGRSHNCALLADQTVECWGSNYYGQLGNGTAGYNKDSSTPVQAVGITTAIAIAVGQYHTCALLADQTVHCWGDNDDGQIGQGTGGYSSIPVEVNNIDTSTAIAAGGDHTCAVLANQTVECWGDNYYGQLGNGIIDNSRYESHSSTPTKVDGITTATSIAAGEEHTCTLLADQTVECWGNNSSGQLGNGIAGYDKNSSTPVQVVGITTATAIAAGRWHTCAILSDGTVKCWGDNYRGKLGDGTTTSSSTPVRVVGVTTATAIAVGSSHTCAILSDSTVKCWGENRYGQLGNGTQTDSLQPIMVQGITTATAIAAAGDYACALLADQTVQCWGANAYDNPEECDPDTNCSTIPLPVREISEATAIAAGGGHTCALLSDGTVQCWGDYYDGRLGESIVSSTPAQVVGITPAMAIAGGRAHTCALLNDQTIQCWGDSHNGQLGDGSQIYYPTPVPVIGLP